MPEVNTTESVAFEAASYYHDSIQQDAQALKDGTTSLDFFSEVLKGSNLITRYLISDPQHDRKRWSLYLTGQRRPRFYP